MMARVWTMTTMKVLPISGALAMLTTVATAMHAHAADGEGSAALSAELSAPVCVAAGDARPSTDAVVWHDAPGVSGARFAIVWNPDFLTYEILWANATSQPLQFHFVADSGRAVVQQPAPRRLRPQEKESMPGATVIPGHDTHTVCVRTDRAP
jgi:hypothetical protein